MNVLKYHAERKSVLEVSESISEGKWLNRIHQDKSPAIEQ